MSKNDVFWDFHLFAFTLDSKCGGVSRLEMYCVATDSDRAEGRAQTDAWHDLDLLQVARCKKVVVVVKLYFNTVNPFRREIYTNIIKKR